MKYIFNIMKHIMFATIYTLICMFSIMWHFDTKHIPTWGEFLKNLDNCDYD